VNKRTGLESGGDLGKAGPNDYRNPNEDGMVSGGKTCEDGTIDQESGYEELRNAWNVPIEFHGKVLDQDGSPLKDVTIHFKARSYPKTPAAFGRMDFATGKVVSADDGTFSITGYRGDSLTIESLEKHGYRTPRQNCSFAFQNSPGGYQLSNSEPISFMLVASDLPKAKRILEQNLSVEWNGGPQEISFGPEIGSLRMICSRDALPPTLDRGFAWAAKLSSSDFTMARLDPSMPLQLVAPADGYRSAIEFHGDKSQTPWNNMQELRFHIKTKDGRFGIASLTLYLARSKESRIGGTLAVHLNERGSRNLDR